MAPSLFTQCCQNQSDLGFFNSLNAKHSGGPSGTSGGRRPRTGATG